MVKKFAPRDPPPPRAGRASELSRGHLSEISQDIPASHGYLDSSPTVLTAITRYLCRSPALAVVSVKRIGTKG